MASYSGYLGLGIAGNFALHLDQAGEAEDFKSLKIEDENAPKGIFPFYIPNAGTYHGTYPLSETTIHHPGNASNIQMEPEVVLRCAIEYCDGKVSVLHPLEFGAYNDCSIRKKGAKKISEKKNWGRDSKGIASTLLGIDMFCSGGVMDSFSIVSYIKRGGVLIQYGENAELTGYSYFYNNLSEWIVNQLNTQIDEGPLEPVLEYIKNAAYPEHCIISIGATRYTEFGETHFLECGDEIYVCVYDHHCYSQDEIEKLLGNGETKGERLSILKQKVLCG